MRHLFISNSEVSRTLPKVVRVFLLAVSLLIMSDPLVGFFIRHVFDEPPNMLPGIRNSYGINRLWELEALGLSSSSIVFMGNSFVEMGFTPEAFIKTLQSRQITSPEAVNLGVQMSNLTVWQKLLRHIVLPSKPSQIFIGLEFSDLHDNPNLLKPFQESSLGSALLAESSVEQAIHLWLLKHSTFIGYQKNLREWISGERMPNELDTDAKRLGQIVDKYGYLSGSNKLTRNPTGLQQTLPFQPSITMIKIVIEIATMCKDAHIPCILISMPIDSQAYDYITPADQELFIKTLKDIAQQAQISIWDFNTSACRDVIDDNLYFDLTHLNHDGALKFTTLFTELYVQQILHDSTTTKISNHCAQLIMP